MEGKKEMRGWGENWVEGKTEEGNAGDGNHGPSVGRKEKS